MARPSARELRLAAAAVFVALAALEIFAAAVPALVPDGLALMRAKWPDPAMFLESRKLGYELRAPRLVDYRWGGRTVRIETRPFADGRGAGRRVKPGSPDGRPDVVVFGDSFVYGGEFSWEDSWIGKLEGLSGAKIENYGVPGYSAAQSALMVEERAAASGAGLALFFIAINDGRDDVAFSRWLAMRDDPRSPAPEYSRSRMRASGVCSGFDCAVLGWAQRAPMLTLRLISWAYQSSRLMPADDARGVALIEEALVRAQAAAGAAKLPLAVVLGDGWARYPAATARFKAAAAAGGTPLLELGAEGRLPRIPIDLHWTKEGHEAAAARVQAFLTALAPRTR